MAWLLFHKGERRQEALGALSPSLELKAVSAAPSRSWPDPPAHPATSPAPSSLVYWRPGLHSRVALGLSLTLSLNGCGATYRTLFPAIRIVHMTAYHGFSSTRSWQPDTCFIYAMAHLHNPTIRHPLVLPFHR